MQKAVVCVVDSREVAEMIVGQLHAVGFRPSDISVLLPNAEGTRDFAQQNSTKAPEGAATGVVAGGALGGTIGLLAGIGALAIPGLGPFIAAGPLMAALSGAAAGAAAGGVTGALVGMGIPEYEAKLYEGYVKGGSLLIAVHTEDAEQRKIAKRMFDQAGARDIATVNEAGVPRDARAPRA